MLSCFLCCDAASSLLGSNQCRCAKTKRGWKSLFDFLLCFVRFLYFDFALLTLVQRLATPRKLDPNCTFTPRLDDYTLELLSPSRLQGGAGRPSTAPANLDRLSGSSSPQPVGGSGGVSPSRRKKIPMPAPRPIPPSEFSPVAIAASGKSFLERSDDYLRLHRQVGAWYQFIIINPPC